VAAVCSVLEIASNWMLHDGAERAWWRVCRLRCAEPFRPSSHDVTAGDGRMTCEVTS
jgi:hypothetical protein